VSFSDIWEANALPLGDTRVDWLIVKQVWDFRKRIGAGRMIYTLTLNPALDLEFRVGRIVLGEIHRSTEARADLGGKGFNVSRALQVLCVDSIAVGFAGGYTGKRLEEGLRNCEVQADLVWIEGETRTNVSIVGSGAADYLKVNDAGPLIGGPDLEKMIQKIGTLTKAGDLWVLSGSLPPGVPVDFYARLIRTVKPKGGQVLLDTSGAALRVGLSEAPDLVKPNCEEAAEINGLPADSIQDALASAAQIAKSGPRRVVISMGGKGAVAVEGEDRWYAHPLSVKPANPVGAGDAMAAGLAAGWVRGESLVDMLRLGAACGASAVAQPGTGIGTREEIEKLRLAVVVDQIH
jgi:1-phosphofructokinase family hexose kinase